MSRAVLTALLVALGLSIGAGKALIGEFHLKDAIATRESTPNPTAGAIVFAKTLQNDSSTHEETFVTLWRHIEPLELRPFYGTIFPNLIPGVVTGHVQTKD